MIQFYPKLWGQAQVKTKIVLSLTEDELMISMYFLNNCLYFKTSTKAIFKFPFQILNNLIL